MANLRIPLFVLGALSLASCGEMTPDEQARTDALFACAERADTVFPVLADMPDTAEGEESSGFQIDAAGGFVLTWKAKGRDRPLPDELECRGSLPGRTIEHVELNGVTKRPNPSEIWKY